MGNDEVRIKIKIDSNSQELVLMKQQVQDLGKSFTDTDSMASTFMKRINIAGTIYAGYQLFNKTLGDIARTGFEVNREMQRLNNSLTMSSAVMMANTDIYGNAISTSEKYKLATIDAARTTELLQKANIKTPHTMKETVQIYDSMYISMRKAGATTSDMVEITEKLSIAAGNKVGFDAFLSAMDGIATGTVEANSEMGRFLTSIGLSNEEIKNSSDVIQLFKDKLSDFKAIDNFDTKMSNLTNNTDMFAKNLMKIPFNYLESNLNGISTIVDQMNRGLVRTIVSLSSVSSLSEKNDLILKRQQLLEERKTVENDKFMWDSDQKEKISDINKELAELSQKLALIYQAEDKLDNSVTKFDPKPIDDLVKNTLDPYGVKLDEINQKWSIYFKDLEKNGLDSSKVIEAWSKELEDFNKQEKDKNDKDVKANKKLADEYQKQLSDRQKQYANYYAVIGDWSKLWQIEEQKLREDNTALTQTELTKLIEIKKQAFDKEHSLQKESYSISEIQQYFEMMGDYNNAWLIEESEFYKKWGEIAGENYPHLLETAKKEYFDKANEEQNKLLEKQNEIIDSFNDFKFDAETSGLNDIGKALYSISDLTKELNKEQDLYNKAIIASGNDKEKIAQIEKQHFSNQLSGYSSVASAMSGLFAQGSKEASAMQTIQLGLASVNAVNAVLTQGSGDPYTAFARMAVMAGTVASLMSSIGQTFSIGQMSYSSDSFSSMEANTGTGSVLGDTSAQSKSIVNSMSILEDFAEPQFAVLSQMNKYLASIDSKMGGVSALLYQNAGYGLGKGFEASDNQNISVNSEIAGTVLTAILGGGIGLAVDKLLGGVFSNMLGGITNSILGGLFGKTSTSLKDAGLYFADTLIQSAIEGIEGSTYQTITTTTKSWFSKSSSTNSYFNELDDEIETQFSLVLDNMYNSILVSGEILGKSTDNIENDLSDFVVSIGKISLKDKTADEIQEEISSVFSEIADDMAKDVYPLLAPFQQVGEGLFETLTRVATGIEEADYYIGRLGKTFNEINYTNIENTQGNVGFEALRQSIEAVELATYPTNNGLLDIIENLNATAEELYTVYISLDDLRDRLKFLNQDVQGLSSSMIYGAGSISELEDGFESYFENFLTQSEQLNYKISELEQAFASLGIETPKTKDDFKALLSSLDLTSESGQELYGRLITLSDAFAEVKDGVTDTITSLEDSISDLTSNMKDDLISAFDDVRNSISSLQSIATSFLNSTTSSGNLSIEEQIISYNKLRTQFSSYFDKDGTLLAGIDNEKAQSVYSQMSSLANNISGENSTLRNSLIGQFSHDLANLDFTDQILQVELTGAQGTALTNLSINGVTLDVSQDASSQLNTIAKGYNWNLSDEMIGHLQSKYGWSDKLTTNIQTALDSDFDWSQPNATIQKYFTSKFGWTPTAQDITNLKSAYNWDATDGDVKNLKSKYGWSDKLTANIQTALNSDFDWSQPNATIQKYFTSKFGWTPTEDEIKKLKSSYNWDSNNKGLTTALTTLGKSYDWAYTDLANAVNGVSTYTVNGKKVLAFDWNNDNIIDATAIIGSDGTLEDIKAGVYSDESTTAISTISNLATAIKDYNTLLLNEVAKDTAGLSSATLNYGDYVGKQEQLDISKLLGTSYSNVQGLVTSLQELQPLDNLAQAKGINQLLGFTTGGTSYDTTTAGYIQQLIDEGVITDLTFQNQLTSVINQATSNKKIADAIAEFEADKEDWQTRYNSALASVTEDVQDSIYYKYVHTLRPDVARSYAGSGIRSDTEEQSKNVFTLWWNKNGSKEGAISIENYLKSEVNKLKLTDPTLVSLLKEKKLNGYMNGTSNMLDDQLAMFNQREIVIPTSFSDGIRQGEISLGNNDKLIDKIDDLINITTQQARQIQMMKEKIEDMNTRDMIKTAKGVA